MWEPLGILQQRATPKGRKITLAAEKKLDGRGRENREGSQVKSSYNGVVENRGEPGLSRGSVVDTVWIQEILMTWNQLNLGISSM